MHKVNLAQVKKGPGKGRWYWNISYNRNVLVRSEANYATRAEAVRSAEGIRNAFVKGRITFNYYQN